MRLHYNSLLTGRLSSLSSREQQNQVSDTLLCLSQRPLHSHELDVRQREWLWERRGRGSLRYVSTQNPPPEEALRQPSHTHTLSFFFFFFFQKKWQKKITKTCVLFFPRFFSTSVSRWILLRHSVWVHQPPLHPHALGVWRSQRLRRQQRWGQQMQWVKHFSAKPKRKNQNIWTAARCRECFLTNHRAWILFCDFICVTFVLVHSSQYEHAVLGVSEGFCYFKRVWVKQI